MFLYYPRDTAQTQLEARADADPSVLDRMEASYAAYAASRYTAVPDGYDELQTLCDEAKKDQKLTEAADIGDYIRAYLNTNYQYNASAPQPPEGADPIRYFLTESKQGYSVQFASAAVVMFRMFGLPARYVVGYAAPQSLFTQQEDGSWHAILQDDNAHAWAEVYISGQGWTPMEMTPARRSFQAVRIAVNGELDALNEGMEAIFSRLAPGGRFCIITFHSLEDRLVKQKFRRWAQRCTCPPEQPICTCGGIPKAKLITRKPIEADAGELEENRRSRSAKLRVLEKL